MLSPDPTPEEPSARLQTVHSMLSVFPWALKHAPSPKSAALKIEDQYGQSRPRAADCHKLRKDFLPFYFEDIPLEFRKIGSALPNFANAKLQSKSD